MIVELAGDTDLAEVFLKSARAGTRLQRPDGSMPEGHNGPHNHTMTIARSTAHWSIAYCVAYDRTGNPVYRIAAEAALNRLMQPDILPEGLAFRHRLEPGKDAVNGLIGQAWTLEALAFASRALADSRFRDLGLRVAEAHPFNWRRGLWHRITLGGLDAGLELTANQQAWFAASICLLKPAPGGVLEARVQRFVDCASTNLRAYSTGCFKLALQSSYGPKSILREIGLLPLNGRKLLREKERGYHAFLLMGLAYLFQHYPEHPYWRSRVLRKALMYAFSADYLVNLQENRYGLPYNVPGFELPFIASVFSPKLSLAIPHRRLSALMCQQLSCHLDPGTGLLRLNTTDADTLSARIYELARLIAWADGST